MTTTTLNYKRKLASRLLSSSRSGKSNASPSAPNWGHAHTSSPSPGSGQAHPSRSAPNGATPTPPPTSMIGLSPLLPSRPVGEPRPCLPYLSERGQSTCLPFCYCRRSCLQFSSSSGRKSPTPHLQLQEGSSPCLPFLPRMRLDTRLPSSLVRGRRPHLLPAPGGDQAHGFPLSQVWDHSTASTPGGIPSHRQEAFARPPPTENHCLPPSAKCLLHLH